MTEEKLVTEVPVEKLNRLESTRSQCIGEDWFDIRRIDGEQLRARPVERQDERGEGQHVVSDEWLIEDVNGETYTVDSDTFEEKFHNFAEKTVRLDLSTDDNELEGGVVVAGTDYIVEATAYLNVVDQTIQHMTIERVMWNGREVDALPIEAFMDHEDLTVVEEEQ